jgi:hypothetical protein
VHGHEQLGGDLCRWEVAGQQGQDAQLGRGQRRRPGTAGTALPGQLGPQRLGLADQGAQVRSPSEQLIDLPQQRPGSRQVGIVATGGAVTDGPYPQAIGGFTLLDVPSREEALRWAAKIAVACRCAQEVRAIGADPELDAMLRQAYGRR